MPINDDVVAIREDVAYIRAKIEVLDDHESRLRVVEKRQTGVLGSALIALMAMFGLHIF